MKVRNYDNEIYKRFREELPDILELRFGSALRPLIEGESPLFREINYLRNWIHAELGFILPKIRIRDWLALNPNEYVILINGFEVARYGEMGINDYMCINTTDMIKKEIAGTKTKDPAFDLDAIIITKGQKKKTEELGYVVYEIREIINFHFYAVIKKNITRLLTQSIVNSLINKVREMNPDVVNDVFIEHNFTKSKLKIILNFLLEEGVSIKNTASILETIADNLDETNKLVTLMEKIREKQAHSILSGLADENKTIHIIKLSDSITKMLNKAIYYPETQTELPYFLLKKQKYNKLRKKLYLARELSLKKNTIPVCMINRNLRTAFYNSFKLYFYYLPCISDKEIREAGNNFTIKTEYTLG